jgi:outer membrane receptor protein involved in Fe transport
MNFAKSLLIVAVVGWLAAAFAQEVAVSGVVRDANTHREIRDVSVYIKGARSGAGSDFSGRYELRVPTAARTAVVIFQHVAYERREIRLDSLIAGRNVYLQPRIIPLPGVEIHEEGGKNLTGDHDLPQAAAEMQANDFEMRGFVDAGDLLRTDHSTLVDEDLSGKKTVTIRGGNPDEIVVRYYGVRLNSAYDNVFDLSLIDLDDVDRFEIIKGSNTALYGPDAFSGVINILPKLQQDYWVRFQQRFGTYRSGNWGLHVNQKLDRFFASYNLRRGAIERNYLDSTTVNGRLENTALHHTANLSCEFSKPIDGKPANTLGATYVYSDLDYENRRYHETLAKLNRLFSLKYAGDLAVLKNLDITASLRRSDEEQFLFLSHNRLRRRIADHAVQVDAEKRLQIRSSELTLAYQFQNAQLDFTDHRPLRQVAQEGIESADLKRVQHGLVAIAKFHGEAGSNFYKVMDFDFSLRHDRVHDEQIDPVFRTDPAAGAPRRFAGVYADHHWQETVMKFAMQLAGYRNDLAFSGYVTFGKSAKFPTLLQQISKPDLSYGAVYQPNLNPERNRSVEVGMSVTRDLHQMMGLHGWQLAGNYFQNDYDNKFRRFEAPDFPVLLYDNVPHARISGLEAVSSFFLLRKKVTVDLGLARYFISDKAVFPFRAELKRTLTFKVDHAGYAFELLWFKEGEQIGWIRRADGFFEPITLPDQINLDVHASKKFEIERLKLFASFSGRNLLNGDIVLQGLALRDRRFYLTVGAQY